MHIHPYSHTYTHISPTNLPHVSHLLPPICRTCARVTPPPASPARVTHIYTLVYTYTHIHTYSHTYKHIHTYTHISNN